jgi:uncharacterized membrane protein YfcA
MPNNLTLVHSLLLFSTAFIAGSLNAVAGGGSFITFPHLNIYWYIAILIFATAAETELG